MPSSELEITSVQNPRVKQVVRLRNGHHRRRENRFLIDGVREVRRAVLSGIIPECLFWCEEQCEPETLAWIRKFSLFNPRVTLVKVTAPVLEKMGYGERSEGVLCVARQPEWTLETFFHSIGIRNTQESSPEGGREGVVPLIGVLEGVEKPGNVGAIFRSADGAGLSGLIIADPGTDLFNPNTIRASLGTIFSVPTCTAESGCVKKALDEHGIKIFSALVDGAKNYASCDYTVPCALVLGCEAYGLSDCFRGENIQPVALPMRGIADSLNVSVSAGILFYEALRQRNVKYGVQDLSVRPVLENPDSWA